MIKPFKLEIPDKILQNIYSKVKNYPWHEMPDDGGWDYGTNLNYMKDKLIFLQLRYYHIHYKHYTQ